MPGAADPVPVRVYGAYIRDMDGFIGHHEGAIRLGVFIGIMVLMAIAETWAPRRTLSVARGFRWLNNIALIAVGTGLLRVVFPLLAVAFAGVAQAHGWGLFNQVDAPSWLAVVVSFVALDFVIYLQHRVFHAVPLFWRLHMVHHADPDIDASTGVRFHPFEIVLSMAIKFAAIALLGAPALAVVLFEIVLNATSVFSHANWRLPLGLDRALRMVLVTPDMHRVHHSVKRYETDSNFGFNFSVWDRLCGSYRPQPEAGHETMTIGLSQFQDQRRQGLVWMLLLPFTGSIGDHPRQRAGSAPSA
jgi:sterol desaturase/sphingolipid hydroxylase (fatty acid hydroxylase superfamily)